ncbi:transmembrane protein, putative (macronuclear) [Tetrahymena thermophila SB210]|uniref:Transmembrane protein, putative n=1 Tax=Tetrahymena thermophila (strain SB210) TaxID=312017 RepID=Q22RM1_TETTS|nr:transmembrane protein, putative [Tetrahymena thermophila SB210]EAR88101.2 transmembrane protein, putative [Tetrahymena thermophila SB210]|eukprot:XP_001008346.2 transmembrane protein, putative [Tetrahymena thermophila SB210]
MQTITENFQGQAYNSYLIVKQNATITNIDSSNCYLYRSVSDANYDLNFVNTFLSQDNTYYHDRSRNVFQNLAAVYFILFALQIIVLIAIGYIYSQKDNFYEIDTGVSFVENSSSVVNYYLGTILMPILVIDYNSDCLQNHFTFFYIDPFFPYYFSIVMMIILVVMLAFCCHYRVSMPLLLIACMPLVFKECDKKSDDACGCFLFFLSIFLITLIFYPTLYSILNNQVSITFSSILSTIVCFLSGVKDCFRKKGERIPTSDNN